MRLPLAAAAGMDVPAAYEEETFAPETEQEEPLEL